MLDRVSGPLSDNCCELLPDDIRMVTKQRTCGRITSVETPYEHVDESFTEHNLCRIIVGITDILGPRMLNKSKQILKKNVL